MDKDDVIHDRIINCVKYYGIYEADSDLEYEESYYCFLFLKKTKPTKITHKASIMQYNFGIYYFIIKKLIHLNLCIDLHTKYITKMKIKTLKLIIDILNNNYANIRYNFTIEVIKQYHWNLELIESIKKYNLFPYLERIHPKKIGFSYKKFEESAYIIYDEMRKLQMAWIGVVAKASILHK